MPEYGQFGWEDKNLKEKAIDTALYGAIITPISVGLLSMTEPETAYEVAQSAKPYALSAGVTTGKVLYEESLYRLEERFTADREEAEKEFGVDDDF